MQPLGPPQGVTYWAEEADIDTHAQVESHDPGQAQLHTVLSPP